MPRKIKNQTPGNSLVLDKTQSNENQTVWIAKTIKITKIHPQQTNNQA